MTRRPHRRFTVHRSSESDLGEEGDLLGWGCQFPSGLCVLEWRLEAFPEEQQLENEHQSRYGSIADVHQATGGDISIVDAGDGASCSDGGEAGE